MGSSYRYIFPLLLLITARYASAQSPPSSDSRKDPYIQNANFNPSMAIVIVVLISAFFFLGFFSIYIRNCTGYSLDPRPTRGGGVGTAAAARSRRQRGINPEVLFTFPTFVFSEVKAHKIGKSALECAVCLCEFEDDETLRLLPKCDHVFHADCIDAWLASHLTCPVCRRNLEETDAAAPAVVVPVQEPPVQETPVQVGNQQVTLLVRDEEEGEERKAEIESLERFINMKRSKSRAARPARFPRSHSTGHSLVLPGENLERFTLRLPENVRREVLQTTTSGKGLLREGSSRA